MDITEPFHIPCSWIPRYPKRQYHVLLRSCPCVRNGSHMNGKIKVDANSQPVRIKSTAETLRSHAIVWKTVCVRVTLIINTAKELLTMLPDALFAVAYQIHFKHEWIFIAQYSMSFMWELDTGKIIYDMKGRFRFDQTFRWDIHIRTWNPCQTLL